MKSALEAKSSQEVRDQIIQTHCTRLLELLKQENNGDIKGSDEDRNECIDILKRNASGNNLVWLGKYLLDLKRPKEGIEIFKKIFSSLDTDPTQSQFYQSDLILFSLKSHLNYHENAYLYLKFATFFNQADEAILTLTSAKDVARLNLDEAKDFSGMSINYWFKDNFVTLSSAQQERIVQHFSDWAALPFNTRMSSNLRIANHVIMGIFRDNLLPLKWQIKFFEEVYKKRFETKQATFFNTDRKSVPEPSPLSGFDRDRSHLIALAVQFVKHPGLSESGLNPAQKKLLQLRKLDVRPDPSRDGHFEHRMCTAVTLAWALDNYLNNRPRLLLYGLSSLGDPHSAEVNFFVSIFYLRLVQKQKNFRAINFLVDTECYQKHYKYREGSKPNLSDILYKVFIDNLENVFIGKSRKIKDRYDIPLARLYIEFLPLLNRLAQLERPTPPVGLTRPSIKIQTELLELIKRIKRICESLRFNYLVTPTLMALPVSSILPTALLFLVGEYSLENGSQDSEQKLSSSPRP